MFLYLTFNTTAMKQKLIPLLFSISVCLFISCKEEKTPEDYIVHVGNQAFGVYLNGQPWIADYRDAGNGIEPIDIAMLQGGGVSGIPVYNYIWATAKKSNEEVSVYIPPPLVPGRVLLNTNTFPYPQALRPAAYGMYRVYSPTRKYITTNVVTGYIDIIRADTVQRSIEARFEFEAINTATNEKIKITNGYLKKN